MPTVRIPVVATWTTATGSPGTNVWHGRVDSIADPNPDVDALADILHTFYEDISDLFPGFVTVRFLGEAYGVGDDEGTIFTGDEWVVNGSGDGSFLPPANCMYVNWRSASGGRNGRGRTFLGPCTLSTAEANGTPTEGRVGMVQAAAEALIDASDSFGNGALGVYSRVEDTFRDFVNCATPNRFAVLRSRRD